MDEENAVPSVPGGTDLQNRGFQHNLVEGNSPGRRVWAPGKCSKFSALNFGVAQFTDGETKLCWTPKLAPLHVRWQTPCQQQWLCSKLGFEWGIYLIGFKATESFKLTPPITQAIGGGGEGGVPGDVLQHPGLGAFLPSISLCPLTCCQAVA